MSVILDRCAPRRATQSTRPIRPLRGNGSPTAKPDRLSELPLAQVLEMQVLVEPVHRALTAVAGFLDATERRRLGRERTLVDADEAGLERVGHAPNALDITRVKVRSQAVWGGIGGHHHLGLALEARHRYDRAEGFLTGASHRRVGPDQHGWREIVRAQRRQALATDDHAC